MADWDYFKIAEGPLDIVGKTLKVLTSESNVPIVTNNWRNDGDYWELRVRSDEPYIRETLCVLDNTYLDDAYVTNGTLPLTGIFVSANIRSISIPESEEVHKIDAKYTESIPSIILEYNEREGESVQKNGGSIYLAMGDDPLSVTLKLSTGDPCSYIEVFPITSSAMEAESHASIELSDGSTGEYTITPAEYDGSHSRIIDTYLLTYASSERVDGKLVIASFYLVIQSERMI